MPTHLVRQERIDTGRDIVRIGRLDEHAVLKLPDHIDRPPDAGGNDRQTVHRRLQDRQAKRLDQRRVHENTARSPRQRVEPAHLRLGMLTRPGRSAVQIEPIDCIDKLAHHLHLLRFAGFGGSAQSGQDDQIGAVAQVAMATEAFDERDEVFLPDRTRNGEDDRAFRVAEEGRDELRCHALLFDAGLPLLDPRLDTPELLLPRRGIRYQLPFALVSR